MRRRIALKKYILLAFTLFILTSLPFAFIEKTRGKCISLVAPFCSIASAGSSSKGEENEKAVENHLLRIEIGKLMALLEQERHMELSASELRAIADPAHYEEACFLLGLQARAVPARVIYRDPASWSSCLWINAGEQANEKLGRKAIARNSPVVIGHSLIGVVDFVGKKQSRIRLITDVGMKPSVRAVRGSPLNLALVEHIEAVLRNLTREDLPMAKQDRENLMHRLKSLQAGLAESSQGWYLAKGILQGGGAPLWRCLTTTLKGIGFNYDFPDREEGVSEFAGTGMVQKAAKNQPIIQKNDLLVTTGMDGIFPPGLRVASVSNVHPLREGAYTYDIEAEPAYPSMNEIQIVFVLPPVSEAFEFLENRNGYPA